MAESIWCFEMPKVMQNDAAICYNCSTSLHQDAELFRRVSKGRERVLTNGSQALTEDGV